MININSIPEAIECSYKKGTIIMRQDEEVPFIYYLIEGECYRSYINEQGEESIFGYLPQGTYVGALALLVDPLRPINNSNIIAREECKGYKIANDIFLELLSKEQALNQELLQRAIKEIVDINKKYIYMKEGKIANRLCQLLLEEAEEKDGVYRVSKRFNHTEQAKLLGVHHVTISRIIKRLREENVIEKTKDGILLKDRDKLIAYSNGEKINYK